MTTAAHPIPGFRFRYRRGAEDFADRHFTDPEVRIEDAAVYLDVDPRTLRDALAHTGGGWREMLRTRRIERGAQLLVTTNYLIADVARLAGYESASAFAKVFREERALSPAQWRRAHKGPGRAGGATGAFARTESPKRPGIHGGWEAVVGVRMDEAFARIGDRRRMAIAAGGRLGTSIAALTDEMEKPRRLRDERAVWQGWTRRFAEWVEQDGSRDGRGLETWSPEWIELLERGRRR